MTKKQADILVVLETVERCYKGYSLEFQWQMTCDFYLDEFHEEITHADIADALFAEQLLNTLNKVELPPEGEVK